MELSCLTFRLPDWLTPYLEDRDRVRATPEERMYLAVELSRRNVELGTGGPFGAAIFDSAGHLVAPGVNLVVSGNCSVLHAEMVAIMLAQTRLGRFDLGQGGSESFELASSTEPCAMCFGAVPWSGVNSLVCGARGEDARRIGFDEGAKPADWIAALNARGIRVTMDILRPEAVEVLNAYARRGGAIYNSGTR